MFICIYNRSQVSVYRTIGPLVIGFASALQVMRTGIKSRTRSIFLGRSGILQNAHKKGWLIVHNAFSVSLRSKLNAGIESRKSALKHSVSSFGLTAKRSRCTG